MSVLIVGSIAIDTIITPKTQRPDILGGSASFASVSASFFTPVNLVGIVGSDFPAKYLSLLEGRGINLAGVQRAEGPTMRWTGEYMDNMNVRETRVIALNVFETFTPTLPESYRDSEYVLLANIAPHLQSHVLGQMKRPEFVVADTMDLWITIALDDLKTLLTQVDMLILNDGEARQLAGGESNVAVAARKIQEMGPRYVAVKKGEHGCLVFGEGKDEFFTCGAYPLEEVNDPTGAGDTFAGGFAGYLASRGADAGEITFADLRQAAVRGTVMASFSVEDFSLDRLSGLTPEETEGRLEKFRQYSAF